MFYSIRKKIFSVLLFVSMSVVQSSAANLPLTDTQLHAVLGIITNFILSDVDSDGDGVYDSQDAFPDDPAESVDTDGDGVGNNADTDDDGDGISDADEVAAGSDPLDANSIASRGVVYNVVTSPYTGHKWLDRNLGASQVCTAYNDANCYGDYYQWGRDADGHEDRNSDRTTTLATSNPVGHNKFIQGHPDWISGFEHNYPEQRAARWSRRDGSSVCPVGFRVPTKNEFKTETLDRGVTNRDTAYTNFLKLPSSGFRYSQDGYMIGINADGMFWSSTVEGNNASLIYFVDNQANIASYDYAFGFSVRCIKPIVTTDAPPVVTLHSSANIEMIQFGSYPIINVAAVDDVDGVLVPNVVARDSQGQVLGSFIDTSTAGTYTLAYTATDSAGQASNTATVTVTVHPAMKKTGQTKSYDADGDEVIDGSLKDDGHYQKGHNPLYARDDGSNIVKDNITGLEWADDANVADSSMKKQWLIDANYDICTGENGATQDTSKCTDTSGDTAATYCTALSLGGHQDWRLPTRKELVGLADYGQINTAMNAEFENVASSYYWSSTTYAGNASTAWRVLFGYGNQYYYYKSNSYYVRCVRAGQ